MTDTPSTSAAAAADWLPTQAGVAAVMAAVSTPVDDEGVEFVAEVENPACPTCKGQQFIIPAHCRCLSCSVPCPECHADEPRPAPTRRSSLRGGLLPRRSS